MSKATPSKTTRRLIGKRLVKIELQPTRDPNGQMYRPRLIFDDGTVLSFTVQESFDGGFYGVYPNVHTPSPQEPTP